MHVMAVMMEKANSMLRDLSFVQERQGAGMLVTSLVEELGVNVTCSFVALVPVLPLGRVVSPPNGLSEKLSSRSVEDAHFLEQLLDNSQVDDYKLVVELKVTLRRYQQEGINLLAFLKRFKLRGILCDDMGLGKTLQASEIVASDAIDCLAFKKIRINYIH
eukprot:Gb_30442 [translate_table: standard]